MSRVDIASLASAAATLRFNVVVADYALPNVSEARAHHHKATLKAEGYQAVAETFRALLAINPKHPSATDWKDEVDSALLLHSTWNEAKEFWGARLAA